MAREPVPWCDMPIIDPQSEGGGDIREMPCGECEACLQGMLYDRDTGRIFVPLGPEDDGCR